MKIPSSFGAAVRLLLFLIVVGSGFGAAEQSISSPPGPAAKPVTGGTDIFDWQYSEPPDRVATWQTRSFSVARWWGGFPKEEPPADMWSAHPWALGPIVKHAGNPILAPTSGAWDRGRFAGGVHNGATVVKDGIFYYVYRGEQPYGGAPGTRFDYICDIGVATSKDGIHFTKDTVHSPFFRKGDDERFSYEDVNIARHGDTYYLFCNQWYWPDMADLKINGTFLATSKDLVNWTKHGIVFPHARRVHRNAVVLQNPRNEAVRVNGRFVMYLNNRLMAYSDDMLNWETREPDAGRRIPGGECCFALADHRPDRPDDIILFTGGHHSGHFYAVGEVLFSKKTPEHPIAWLPRPVLTADPQIKHENGFAAEPPHEFISSWADCVFFNGLTRYAGKWWFYYGGSEYYTCLATAEAGD